MFYLITGENTTLIEDEIENIEQKFNNIPFEKINAKTSFETFIFNTESCDMFSPQKGQFIHEPNWFKKTTKSQQATFEQCLKTAKNHQLPMAFIMKKVDKRSANYKLLKRFSFTELNCPEFKEWESQKMIQWICNYCKKIDVSITTETAQILIEAYGSQLGIIKQEIHKCVTAILPEKTLTKTILLQTSNNAIGEYALLSNAIKNGQINKINQHIFSLMEQKEDPHKIINQMIFLINQLLPVSFAINNRQSSDELSSKLGKHPFFIKKLMETLSKNPIHKKLPQFIMLLATLDKQIKTGKLSGKQALIKFSNNIKYQI